MAEFINQNLGAQNEDSGSSVTYQNLGETPSRNPWGISDPDTMPDVSVDMLLASDWNDLEEGEEYGSSIHDSSQPGPGDDYDDDDEDDDLIPIEDDEDDDILPVDDDEDDLLADDDEDLDTEDEEDFNTRSDLGTNLSERNFGRTTGRMIDHEPGTSGNE